IIENVELFLEHGASWRDHGEPGVAEFRQDAEKIEPAGTTELGDAASLEVDAWQMACLGDWNHATEKLQEAARRVTSEATRGYRGLLLYIAGTWLHLGAQDDAQ